MKRNTWQREAVRDALDATDGFISAQALHSALHASGSPIGLATVYRALGDLASNGEADSLQSPDGEALYRACSTTGHHHHLICRQCGRSADVEDAGLQAIVGLIGERSGYVIDSHRLELFGLCPECAP